MDERKGQTGSADANRGESQSEGDDQSRENDECRHGNDDGRGDEWRREPVRARGHENVSAEHASTLEVTSDDFLTPAGDCILAIEADRVPADFGDAFVAACATADATITMTVEAAGRETVVTGSGHPDLTFASDRSFVCRTSDYVDDRTAMVGADAAAADLDRDLVAALADGAEATVTFAVREGR